MLVKYTPDLDRRPTIYHVKIMNNGKIMNCEMEEIRIFTFLDEAMKAFSMYIKGASINYIIAHNFNSENILDTCGLSSVEFTY